MLERAGRARSRADGAADAVDGAAAGRDGAGDGDGDVPDRTAKTASDTVNIQVTGAAGAGVHVRGRALRLRPLLAAAGSDAGARRGDRDAAGRIRSCDIEIEGHTCNIGTAEYNLALGERRATAVRDYLSSRGIGADRLRTVSYGEERPKYDNTREETRRLNRRAALVVRSRAGANVLRATWLTSEASKGYKVYTWHFAHVARCT